MMHTLWGRLTRWFTGSPPRTVVRARYDAAQPSDDTRQHWACADSLSARQANSPEVRRIVRERARYEVANNCYAAGMIHTVADVMIGRGAQLQILRRGNDTLREAAQLTERLFGEWAEEVDLWGKLWTLRVARSVDGEGCGLLRTDRRLASPVKLTLQLLETEHITHGWRATWDPDQVDGVELDDLGEVRYYYVTRRHPAEDVMAQADPVRVRAQDAIVWLRVVRPGQVRGISEIMPALPLFALLRRFTLATLTAAEFAASISGAVQTEGPAQDAPVPWERIEYERNAFLTLPQGATLSQLRSEHPSTTFDTFRVGILCEAGRVIGLPRALALLDSSAYNYASSRMDLQGVYQWLQVDRALCEAAVLRKVWRAWLSEARLIDGYLPPPMRSTRPIKVRWLWPGLGHVDRAKEAAGTQIDLDLHRTTLADECARDGRDWEEVMEQRAVELARARSLGLVSDAMDALEPETVSGEATSRRMHDEAIYHSE